MEIHPLAFRLYRVMRSCFAKDGHYLLAVSGGSDSMALATACSVLAGEGWGHYSVCHVEHGLRGEEALRDMALVQRFCAERGLELYIRHVDVRALAAAEHFSIETAARQLRHAALREVLRTSGASGIVFAHNRDDQAETVLLRLLRGTSLKGLGGIRYDGALGLHPLLGFTHRELAEFCELQQVPYCHDSTNDELVYTRNRVRHELLPYLEQHFNSGIKPALARMAEQLQLDEEYLADEARRAYQEAVRSSADCTLCFAAASLERLAPAIRRRVLRRAYYELAQCELDYERTLALEGLVLARTGGKRIQLPGGICAVYRKKQIIFEQK